MAKHAAGSGRCHQLLHLVFIPLCPGPATLLEGFLEAYLWGRLEVVGVKASGNGLQPMADESWQVAAVTSSQLG